MAYLMVLGTLLAWLFSAQPAAANTPALFNGGAVAGCTYTAASQTYDCPPFSSSLDVTIASGYKVVLSGPMDFDYNQQLNMSGTAQLQVNGNLDIGGVKTSNLNITGGSLISSGQFKMGAQVQTIVADISAASMKIGTGSATKVTGTLTSTGPIDIASHAIIIGNISGTIIDTDSPVALTGNVTASTSFTLASGSSLTGNVTAGFVEIKSSESYITGNAVVNSIKLGWHGRVQQTITCPAPAPGTPCNCVTNDSGYTTGSLGPVCTTGASSVHHYRIIHAGGGLTCQPKTVTLRACADASCSTQYTGTATGSLTLLSGGNAMADVTPVAFSIASTNGSDNASVRKSQPGSGTLTVSGASPAAANATVCVSGGGSSCTMNFYDAGFNVTVANQLSGVSTPFTVEALQNNNASPSSCIPLVANQSRTLAMRCTYVNPTTNGNTGLNGNPGSTNFNLSASDGGVVSSASMSCGGSNQVSGVGNLPLRFDANGKATGSMIYDDVGQVSLSAAYVSASAPFPNISGTSAPFIVAPHHYTVDSINVPSPLRTNPGATTATEQVFTQAGRAFNARVIAMSARNILSGNFARETPPGRVTVSSNLVLPAGGENGVLSGPTAVFTDLNPGYLYLTGLAWNEVGIMTITAKTSATQGLYAGLPEALLGSGTSGNVGRFIPDHFDTRLAAGDTAPMDCSAAGITLACQGGKFVYAAQPLGLEVYPMTAAATPTVTRNYTGAFARTVAVTAWNAAGASALAAANPEWRVSSAAATATATGPSASPALVFAGGLARTSVQYAFSTAFNQAVVAPNPANDFSRPVNVFFRAAETGGDGVTSLRGASSAEAGIAVASGRLLVETRFGSELLRQNIALQSQYWNGTRFTLNRADATASATSLTAPGVVALSGCTGTLKLGSGCIASLAVSPPPSTLTFSQGVSSLRLGAPGAGKSGTVGVTVNAIPWLPSSTGRVTYGVYRSPVIFLREVY